METLFISRIKLLTVALYRKFFIHPRHPASELEAESIIPKARQAHGIGVPCSDIDYTRRIKKCLCSLYNFGGFSVEDEFSRYQIAFSSCFICL